MNFTAEPLGRRPPTIQLLTVDKFPSMASMRRSASLALMAKREIFCKSNGEGLFIFNSHKLKDDNDELILCQIVREYECPNCHASRGQAVSAVCSVLFKTHV